MSKLEQKLTAIEAELDADWCDEGWDYDKERPGWIGSQLTAYKAGARWLVSELEKDLLESNLPDDSFRAGIQANINHAKKLLGDKDE